MCECRPFMLCVNVGHLHSMLMLLCVNLILPFCYWLVFFPISWLILFIAILVFAQLVCFCSVWYLFLSVLSVSFRNSCRAGLVVTKSLNNCLSIKNFISPSLMKLSLTGYEILGWKFFSLRMLNIGPHSLLPCTVSANRSAVNLIGLLLWVTWPFSLWLSLAFFPSSQPWWIWWLCALGLLFLRNIFVKFSVFIEFETWTALLGLGSSSG